MSISREWRTDSLDKIHNLCKSYVQFAIENGGLSGSDFLVEPNFLLWDLVVFDSSSGQFLIHTNFPVLYSDKDPDRETDFFYIKKYQEQVRKEGREREFEIQIDSRSFASGSEANPNERYGKEEINTSTKSLAHSEVKYEDTPPNLDTKDVLNFYRPAKHCNFFKIIKGYYKGHEQARIVFVLGLGFAIQRTKYHSAKTKDNGVKFDVDGFLHEKFNQILRSSTFRSIWTEKMLSTLSLSLGIAKSEVEVKLKNALDKAAIAQAFNRNLSHNHGSHSMPNFIGENHLFQQILEYIRKGKQQYWTSFPEEPSNACGGGKENECPVSYAQKYLARYIDYLKSRMAFIADISTATPTLNQSMYLINDVFKPFDKNLMLLNTISGVENFKFRFKWIINGHSIPVRSLEKAMFQDLKVAFPNGRLGCQAFYTILENFIRNKAKYNHPGVKAAEELVITLSIKEVEDNSDLWEVQMYDNLSEYTMKLDNLVENMNEQINRSILIDESRLRPEGLGTLEMKASAAYLRMKDMEEIDQLKTYDHYPILEAIAAISSKKKRHFGYRFFLLKEKFVLTIGDDGESDEHDGIDHLPKQRVMESTKPFRHQILLVEDWDKYKRSLSDFVKHLLPIRIVDVNQVRNYLKQNNLDKKANQRNFPFGFTYEDCYGAWISLLMDKHRVKKIEISGINNEIPLVNALQSKWGKGGLRAKFDLHGMYWTEESSQNDYFEPHPSHDNKLVAISNHSDTAKGLVCAEAVLTRIAIVDERIQDLLSQSYYSATRQSTSESHPIKYDEIYQKTGVIIPKKLESEGGFNLKSEDLPVRGINFLFDWIKRDCRKIDFFVIHLGLIERMIKDDHGANIIVSLFPKFKTKAKLDEKIKFLLSEIQKALSKHSEFDGPEPVLVVTSARGNASNQVPEIRYVNYSSLESYLGVARSKIRLTQLVFSSRISNRIG